MNKLSAQDRMVEDRIKLLQDKIVLTDGERIELQKLLNMKWDGSRVEAAQDSRQLLTED